MPDMAETGCAGKVDSSDGIENFCFENRRTYWKSLRAYAVSIILGRQSKVGKERISTVYSGKGVFG